MSQNNLIYILGEDFTLCGLRGLAILLDSVGYNGIDCSPFILDIATLSSGDGGKHIALFMRPVSVGEASL